MRTVLRDLLYFGLIVAVMYLIGAGWVALAKMLLI
jgi:hypothetical protein